jgi:hypothetical protein
MNEPCGNAFLPLGGAGAKPPRQGLLPLRKPAASHNACIGLVSPLHEHRASKCSSFRGLVSPGTSSRL